MARALSLLYQTSGGGGKFDGLQQVRKCKSSAVNPAKEVKMELRFAQCHCVISRFAISLQSDKRVGIFL